MSTYSPSKDKRKIFIDIFYEKKIIIKIQLNFVRIDRNKYIYTFYMYFHIGSKESSFQKKILGRQKIVTTFNRKFDNDRTSHLHEHIFVKDDQHHLHRRKFKISLFPRGTQRYLELARFHSNKEAIFQRVRNLETIQGDPVTRLNLRAMFYPRRYTIGRHSKFISPG